MRQPEDVFKLEAGIAGRRGSWDHLLGRASENPGIGVREVSIAGAVLAHASLSPQNLHALRSTAEFPD
jgi:hypothetical protein